MAVSFVTFVVLILFASLSWKILEAYYYENWPKRKNVDLERVECW
jgi:hypothetical protein